MELCWLEMTKHSHVKMQFIIKWRENSRGKFLEFLVDEAVILRQNNKIQADLLN